MSARTCSVPGKYHWTLVTHVTINVLASRIRQLPTKFQLNTLVYNDPEQFKSCQDNAHCIFYYSEPSYSVVKELPWIPHNERNKFLNAGKYTLHR